MNLYVLGSTVSALLYVVSELLKKTHDSTNLCTEGVFGSWTISRLCFAMHSWTKSSYAEYGVEIPLSFCSWLITISLKCTPNHEVNETYLLAAILGCCLSFTGVLMTLKNKLVDLLKSALEEMVPHTPLTHTAFDH